MKKSNEALNEKIYKQFQKGLDFNDRIDLCDNVETSENFFIGRQWEGVQANGLPTPVFNFLKRIVLHQVANITSDNITMNAKPLAAAPNDKEMERVVSIVNEEFAALMKYIRENDIKAFITAGNVSEVYGIWSEHKKQRHLKKK